jgi:hypothetical protein
MATKVRMHIQNGPTLYRISLQRNHGDKLTPWKVGKETVVSNDHEYIWAKAHDLHRDGYAQVQIKSQSWWESSFQICHVLRGPGTLYK